jgi:hypothetical protein
MSRAHVLAAALALCACLPGTALGAPRVTMSAAFAPNRLGAQTALSLAFRIASSNNDPPPPLTGLDFHFPVNLGLATSGLGVASCPIAPLEQHGPTVCPPDSRMGSGSARVEIPVGGGIQTETASIALLAGPSENGYVKLLITATGLSPVIARVVIPSLLRPGDFNLDVPLVESLPGAADVSIVEVHMTLGGNLTYYETVRGRTVPYRPAGIGLPRTCPRGGFPFSSTFTFVGGTRRDATTRVACPRGG